MSKETEVIAISREERERARMEREQLRRRRLKVVKICGALLLAVILMVILVSAISGAVSPKPEEPPESSEPAVAVGKVDEGSSQPDLSSVGSSPAQQLSDPLLVLVNDETPLPEDWQVTLKTFGGESGEQVDQRAYDDLSAMINAAAADEVTLWVASGYRSVELQESILDRAVRENMDEGMTEEEAREDALRTINRPRYSEHHTGLAVDLNDVNDGFEETDAYLWLSQHAAEYGFVQRYKQSKVSVTGIDNESWHYRYVGKTHAEEMERLDLCLEEYIEYLKTNG